MKKTDRDGHTHAGDDVFRHVKKMKVDNASVMSMRAPASQLLLQRGNVLNEGFTK